MTTIYDSLLKLEDTFIMNSEDFKMKMSAWALVMGFTMTDSEIEKFRLALTSEYTDMKTFYTLNEDFEKHFYIILDNKHQKMTDMRRLLIDEYEHRLKRVQSISEQKTTVLDKDTSENVSSLLENDSTTTDYEKPQFNDIDMNKSNKSVYDNSQTSQNQLTGEEDFTQTENRTYTDEETHSQEYVEVLEYLEKYNKFHWLMFARMFSNLFIQNLTL